MLWPRQSNPGLPPRDAGGQLPARQTAATPPAPCSRRFRISQPAAGSHTPQAPQAVSKKHIEVSGEEARSRRQEANPTFSLPLTPVMHHERKGGGKEHRIKFLGLGRFQTVQHEMKNNQV